MAQDAKADVAETIRKIAKQRAENGRFDVSRPRVSRADLEARADAGRRELGDVVVDLTEDYFPEAVRRRRRRDVAVGFTAGAAVGYALRHFLRR